MDSRSRRLGRNTNSFSVTASSLTLVCVAHVLSLFAPAARTYTFIGTAVESLPCTRGRRCVARATAARERRESGSSGCRLARAARARVRMARAAAAAALAARGREARGAIADLRIDRRWWMSAIPQIVSSRGAPLLGGSLTSCLRGRLAKIPVGGDEAAV